jgi:plastocyanin
MPSKSFVVHENQEMSKIITIIVILAIVILGGYFLLKGPEATAPEELVENEEIVLEEAEETSESGPQEESAAPANSAGTEPVSSSEPAASSGMPVPENEGVEEMIATHVITYTSAGYSPNSLAIKVGETVTWENRSSQNMWTASAMHPTHSAYAGTTLSAHCPDGGHLAFDACKGYGPGESWSFAFEKVGTWSYHDHLHPTIFGKIVVE